MKTKLSLGLLGLAITGIAQAGTGLYSVGAEPEDPMPFHWAAGVSFIYDDNILASERDEQDSWSVNPHLSASMISITPQTLIELYGRLGMLYYFDTPDGIDDTNSQSNLNLRVRHNFTERVGFTTTNNLAYQLEPDYKLGYAGSRASEEHFYWTSDNYVSFLWNERLTSRTGVVYSGVEYEDTDSLNRETITGYHQFRYRLQPLTILTGEYRYSTTTGDLDAADSETHYLLGGVERRVSPNMTLAAKAGLQIRDVDNGESTTNPYVHFSCRHIVNDQFSYNAFIRYGLEEYDTVHFDPVAATTIEFDERTTLRLGLDFVYKISPKLNAFAGLNYINTAYDEARNVLTNTASSASADEELVNAYLGFNMQLTEYLTGSISYAYTDSNSDLIGRDYDRGRFSIGVDAHF